MVGHLCQVPQLEKNMVTVAMGMRFESQVDWPSVPSDCSSFASLQVFCFFDILANCFYSVENNGIQIIVS